MALRWVRVASRHAHAAPATCAARPLRSRMLFHTACVLRAEKPGKGDDDAKKDPDEGSGEATEPRKPASQRPARPSPETKRSIILEAQKRKSRMFNPREYDDGKDEPPIHSTDRLLPLQLPFRPVYPGASTYMVSGDPKLMSALRKLNETPAWDRRVFAVLSKTPIKTTQVVGNVDDVHDVGCVCLIDNITVHSVPESGAQTAYAVLFPMFRARVGELAQSIDIGVTRAPSSTSASQGEADMKGTKDGEGSAHDSPLDKLGLPVMRDVRAVPNEPYAVSDDELQRLCVRVIDSLREISMSSGTAKRLVDEFSALVVQAPGGAFPQPDFLADFTASILPKSDALQRVLAERDVSARLKMVAELAAKEVTYLRVQEGIARYGHSQTELRNREMILHEYLRYIKKELGLDGDDKSRASDKFAERASKLDMPESVRQVFNDELNKFRALEPTSGEYNTVRTYLDWLSTLPWGKTSVDRFDLNAARKLLDASHYGMRDVKNRILEFLAVGKLTGTVDGKIVCLAGPPGVGKTSIAKSIAESLNRKFDRFSVGGLSDASEIKGHRRTYVAAMPGRIVQALKRTQTLNPVILIDEIDKLGASGTHGSPSAALLEVLDPEQNKSFQDTYLEVPIDLSKVLFLCTANYLDNIPPPLMDRMEVINVSGYLPQEKVEIAYNHLGPKYKKEAGLAMANVEIGRDALDLLVQKYTREAGVRGLAKNIEKIFRKIAVNFVNSEDDRANKHNVDFGDKTVPEVTSTAGAKGEGTDSPTAPASRDKPSISSSSPPAHSVPPPISKAKVSSSVPSLYESIEKFSLKVGKEDVKSYVGAPVHNSGRLYDVFPPGVAMGLGWTPNGGMPLFIESVLQEPLASESKPRFARTGQLGEVMNESTTIAYSFARMYVARKFPRNHFLEHAVIHTHFPEGSIKKDGPSAGVTMATSLLSLAMDLPVNSAVAMTGELSLTGKVLQIGGLREKTVAAKTAGARIIVFPEDNKAEWEELTDEVKQGLEPVPVKTYQQVFDIAFGQVDAAKVNAAWPELEAEKKKEKEKSMGVGARPTI